MSDGREHIASPRPGAWLDRSPGTQEERPAAAARDGDGRQLPADLRALARGTLRSALRAHVRAHTPDAESRAALRRLCDAAQVRGLHAEQLLILLKEEWRALPAPRLAAREHDGAVLAGVITLCIDEYYSPRRR